MNKKIEETFVTLWTIIINFFLGFIFLSIFPCFASRRQAKPNESSEGETRTNELTVEALRELPLCS